MKPVCFAIAALVVLSCTTKQEDGKYAYQAKPYVPQDMPDNGGNGDDYNIVISAEKQSWTTATKATETKAGTNDIPWATGEKVLLLPSDQTFEGCTTREDYYDDNGIHHGNISTSRPTKKIVCSVSRINGMKCTLKPDAPLEPGIYRATYPYFGEDDNTDGIWYDIVHLCFYMPTAKGLMFNSRNIMISDPVPYEDGDSLSFMMNHFCSLINIDLYPPKTGTYKHYPFLTSQNPIFSGKVNYWIDREYNEPDDYDVEGVWLDFTALNTNYVVTLSEGQACHTSTGILPIDYDGEPVCVHLFYEDGDHYVSEPFPLPSLSPGMESEVIEVRVFNKTDEPLQGHSSRFFKDPTDNDAPQDWIFQ